MAFIYFAVVIYEGDMNKHKLTDVALQIHQFVDKSVEEKIKLLISELGTVVDKLFPDSLDGEIQREREMSSG